MEQPETAPPSDPAPEGAAPAPPPDLPKGELPDPSQALPVPDKFRLPFHGKMELPTSVPSPAERLLNLQRIQKRKRRRGFLLGVLAGQLAIILLDLGGEAVLRHMPHIRFRGDLHPRALVFMGMAGGIAIGAFLLLLFLGCVTLRDLFGGKVGFFRAIGRGIARAFQFAFVVGLTLGVVGSTAWFMIPKDEWKSTTQFMEKQGKKAVDKARGWVRPPSTP